MSFTLIDNKDKCCPPKGKSKKKLNYRFHNPNSEKVTADYILKIFIEANTKKVELAVQKSIDTSDDAQEKTNERLSG